MRHGVVSGLAMLSLSLSPHAAVAKRMFYLLGAVGNSNADVDLGGLRRIDPADNSFALGGGYQFNENVSLEAAYHDFGRETGRTECPPGLPCLSILFAPEVDATAWSMSFVGSFRVRDRLDGYGRLGVTGWKLDGKASVFDDSGKDLHYGVGVRWSFTDDWKIFAEYTRIRPDVDAVSVGMRFGF